MEQEQAAYMTEEGLRKLKEELEWLKTEKRAEVKERLKIARSYGDLSENSEYDAAKEEQAFVESRILQLEDQIRRAKIIRAEDKVEGVVSIGSTVTIRELPDGPEETYTIVGTAEADPGKFRISNESPIGAGLLGRRAGEEVGIQTPAGEIIFRILRIR
ncbi:transcription elongation factor GreA [Kyrpidia spormannii]|uniref:Transcription elongation factor GreA n=2 Tax=Kyrpidia spormannii TaxID=2055160 RepID=A0A2K8N5L9_9BACL|nr:MULTISPECIES: transcription elongation factor GreA [Kyrpidia]HHY68420.1 transcription elongation factor GreA [Alicyclobacillus sp.]ATY84649.1 transcription elongation factor GreA [Kyrpidia spormannii]MCL6576233.1 transcription elongation factor GreA [Kyrpidia sp.]CAB3391534.1 transcription elongation factor resolving backtracking / stalling [Kyrpidia spormannii]CAB3392447.1 transcription elongation factor resolving backtracking / stalling [Kyrpidia spormannii]